MTPNTFQGVTLGGRIDVVKYLVGYLWEIKPRNSDEFISMSEQAGAKGSNDGVGLAGVTVTPLKGLRAAEDARCSGIGRTRYRLLLRDSVRTPPA